MLRNLQVFVKGINLPPVRPVLAEPWRRAMAGGVPGGSASESTKEEAGEGDELPTNPFWGFI